MSPEFKYPPDSGYEEEYPKLTEYLRNQLPHIATNDLILDAILKYTDLTREEVIDNMKWGQGPTIDIIQLDDACSKCDENTVGLFNPTIPSVIYLDIEMVEHLENMDPGPENLHSDAFVFFVGTTILHEYVHFADHVDGIDYPGEEGRLFEDDAYGQNVTSENSLKILLRRSNNY